MELDVRPILMQCRIYEQGDSFDNRDRYLGTFNVTINGDSAYVSMLQGIWSREIDEMLRRELSTLGVEMLDYEINGRRKQRPVIAFG